MHARASSRACGLVSLLVLAAYVLAIAVGARASGVGFEAYAPWPLGGADASVSRCAQAAALTLGLSLGWGIPGFALALLSDPRLAGVALLGRALGLGTGYVLGVGLVHALALGHAPGRPALLFMLALPPFASALRRSPAEPAVGRVPPGMLLALVAAIALATGLLWPKLQREGLNGDGTEAYELARSLDAHAVPHWDLERSEGGGQFGTPAVNPFLTNSYLAHATMVLLGRGELAVRLFFVPAFVLAAIVSVGRLAPATPSAWLYAAGLGAVSALWSAYYVGYEPAFTDLAEPGATDFLTTALWLAGIGEVLAGSSGWGVAFLLLASGVLYSGPVLATTALVALALVPGGRRRPLGLWLAAASAAVAAVVAWGWTQGLLPDWYRQLRSEYWHDLVSDERRTPSAPLLGLFLLMTGGLPLVAAVRWRRLSPPSRVLLVTGGVYLAIVLGSSYKNLHYLAPLPFIFAAPALEASGARARTLATAALLATLVLSWPDSTRPHRENVRLGEESCLDGIAYEQAALAGDVVYQAFSWPGHGGRFAVGKHTFVRYALDRDLSGCNLRLSPVEREGWIPVAGAEVVLSVRDVDRYARWRFLVPEVPSSWLFPRASEPPPSADPARWNGRFVLDQAPGDALRLGDARVLVPLAATTTLDVETWAPDPGGALEALVNGRPAGAVLVPAGRGRARFDGSRAPWRPGWNVLELTAVPPGPSGLRIEAVDLP
jgi:hypothetical protein